MFVVRAFRLTLSISSCAAIPSLAVHVVYLHRPGARTPGDMGRDLANVSTNGS